MKINIFKYKQSLKFSLRSNYKALLFDFDGTMVDTESIHYKAMARAVNERGGKYPDYAEHLANYSGTTAVYTLKSEKEKQNLDVSVEELVEATEAYYHQILEEEGLSEMKGLSSFLHKLDGKPIKYGIVSGGVKEIVLSTLTFVGIPNIFDVVMTSDIFKVPKPDPTSYLMAAQALKLEPKDCLVFEDGENGIKAALNAGMETVVVGNTITQEKINSIDPTLPHIKDFSEIEVLYLS